MKKYVCDVCGWVYDEEVGYPENGIEPGTKFEDLPDDFECPLCGVGKDNFSEEQIIIEQFNHERTEYRTEVRLCSVLFFYSLL